MAATTIAAVATAVGGGLALWLYLAQRKAAGPTKEEKISTYDDELDELHKEIAAARANGGDARADALMRRVREVSARTATINSPGAAGQRGDDDVASGNTNQGANG
jgi:hypothetical protein